MKVQDLVFYMIGSGEYDELMRAHLLNTLKQSREFGSAWRQQCVM